MNVQMGRINQSNSLLQSLIAAGKTVDEAWAMVGAFTAGSVNKSSTQPANARAAEQQVPPAATPMAMPSAEAPAAAPAGGYMDMHMRQDRL